MNGDISDVESQFEEEPQSPIDSFDTHHGKTWGWKRKAAAGFALITALVLVIVFPVVVAKGGASPSSGDVFSGYGAEDPFEGSTSTGKDGPSTTVDGTQSPINVEVDSSNNSDNAGTASFPYTAKPTSPTTASPTMAPITVPIPTDSVCPLNATQDNITSWIQIGSGIDGESSYDLAGADIAISADGSIIAIGSSENNQRAGHVRTYRYDSGAGFVQLGQDIDGENEFDNFGSTVALDAKGLRLAAGGSFHLADDDTTGKDSGHVRVFDYSEASGSWGEVGQPIAADFEGGQDVALSGDGTRLVIGMSPYGGNVTSHVQVYDLVDNEWVTIGQVLDGESPNQKRSVSISADGKHVAVGSYQQTSSNNGQNAGTVRIYKFDSSTLSWTQIGTDIYGALGFGKALSLSANGSRIAVGSPEENTGFIPLPGITRVYELNNSIWMQTGKDLDGGFSVALSWDGNRAVVGDYRGLDNGINAGQVNTYEFDEGFSARWKLLGNPINGDSGSMFGLAVGISADGSRFVGSAPAYSSATGEQYIGLTRVYGLC